MLKQETVETLFPKAEPVEGLVDFDALYKELKEYFKEHVDLTDERNYSVLASWTFATYKIDDVSCTPHLSILGQKGCGKTRLLETLRQVVNRGFMPIDLTKASLYYMVDVFKPTLLVDETQVYGNEEYGSIRILFSVYRRNQKVPRIGYKAERSKEERIECFSPFGFKAFAGLKDISENVSDRCVQITMLPATRPVNRKVNEVEGASLRNRLCRWTEQELEGPPETTWSNVDPRLSELFETLLTNTPPKEDFDTVKSVMSELSLQKLATQKDSLEADVLRVFYKNASKVTDHWCSTMEIYGDVNRILEQNDFRDCVSTRQVAAILHMFGFKPRRKEHARGFTLDLNRIQGLATRYGVEMK